MLGNLLGIREQLTCKGLIGVTGGSSRPRPRDRPQRDAGCLFAHEDLGGCSHDMEVAEIVVEHVRRWIEGTQRSVELQRLSSEATPHALRNHDLHDVARRDVLT